MVKFGIFLLVYNICLFSACISYSQNTSFQYFADLGDHKPDFYISFYKTGDYEVFFEEDVFENGSLSILLSYGQYELLEDKIVLKDAYNGFNFILSKENDYIIAKDFFFGLNGIKLYLIQFIPCEEPYFIEYKINPISRQRDSYQNLESGKLNLGFYRSAYGFYLEIDQSKSYIFGYKDIVLSSGKFKVINNELILHDRDLDHFFYVFIEKKFLLCKVLPDDFKLYPLISRY